MNTWDKFRQNVAKMIAPKGQTSKGWDGSGAGFYSSGVAHKLQKLIDGSLNYDSSNPRDQMAVARLMVENIPPLKRAMQLQSDFLGHVRFGSDHPKLKAYLNEWSESLPVRSPLNIDYVFTKGMTEFVKGLMECSMKTGMGFAEEYFTEENKADGVVLFDPKCFNFQLEGRVQRLTYSPPIGGGIIYIEPSEQFHILRNKLSTSSLWGESMVSGGEFFGEILIQMLVALKNNYIRYGSPIGINLFTLKPDASMAPDDYQKFVDGVNNMENAFMSALRDSELGARKEIFGKVPGNVDFTHSTYGQGLNPMTGQSEDILVILRQVASLTGIPVELLSFDSGGDGFSGEKWRVLYSILNIRIETYRNSIETIVRSVTNSHIVTMGLPSRWLDSYWVEFDSLDFSNDMTQADTALKRAEATAKEIENAMAIWMELNPGDASSVRRYLDSVGFDLVETGTPQGPSGM
jgi:hypothetical protein